MIGSFYNAEWSGGEKRTFGRNGDAEKTILGLAEREANKEYGEA